MNLKSGFMTDLDVRVKAGTDNVKIVLSPLKYWSVLLQMLVEVPVGFETDLASVPRVPIAYQLWGNRAHREAVLHDYLYRADSNPDVSCSLANEIFFEAMKSTGKPRRIYYPMWLGVVIGGWTAYHKKKVGDKL